MRIWGKNVRPAGAFGREIRSRNQGEIHRPEEILVDLLEAIDHAAKRTDWDGDQHESMTNWWRTVRRDPTRLSFALVSTAVRHLI